MTQAPPQTYWTLTVLIIVLVFLAALLVACTKVPATVTPPGTSPPAPTASPNSGLAVKLLTGLQLACEVGGSIVSPAAAPWFLQYCPAAVTTLIDIIQSGGPYSAIQAAITQLKQAAATFTNLSAKDLGYINSALTVAGQIDELFAPAPSRAPASIAAAAAAAQKSQIVSAQDAPALEALRVRAVGAQQGKPPTPAAR